MRLRPSGAVKYIYSQCTGLSTLGGSLANRKQGEVESQPIRSWCCWLWPGRSCQLTLLSPSCQWSLWGPVQGEQRDSTTLQLAVIYQPVLPFLTSTLQLAVIYQPVLPFLTCNLQLAVIYQPVLPFLPCTLQLGVIYQRVLPFLTCTLQLAVIYQPVLPFFSCTLQLGVIYQPVLPFLPCTLQLQQVLTAGPSLLTLYTVDITAAPSLLTLYTVVSC